MRVSGAPLPSGGDAPRDSGRVEALFVRPEPGKRQERDEIRRL